MQLVDFLRETENKMLHLHKAIDRVSTEPDFKESVGVLSEVIKDYQQQIDKVKTTLSNMQIGINQQNYQNNHQRNGQHQEG